jgi:hypothetical protein
MATVPDRLVLEGVPRVRFYQGGPGCPEDIPFPSVMAALMEYLQEEAFGCRTCRALPPGSKITCTYAFFLGISGVASFLSWKPGWAGDNLEIMYMSDDPAAPFERAFRATGYDYRIVGVEDGRDNEAFFRQQIMESIKKGRPVLAFGPVGPPESAIITGYDEGGDVLIGWSFFQDVPGFNAGLEYEPSGQFRARNWFDYPPGFSFITIGEKKERPPLPETYRSALQWMLQVARTPITFGDRHNGLAAYAAWAEHLLRDEDFPDAEAVLRQRHEVHDAAVFLVAEARWYGSQFLLQASDPDILPYCMAEDLMHAAASYAAEHNLMWEMWDLAGGNGNPDAFRRLADPTVRRKMIRVIEQARDKDELAAGHIERALGMG